MIKLTLDELRFEIGEVTRKIKEEKLTRSSCLPGLVKEWNRLVEMECVEKQRIFDECTRVSVEEWRKSQETIGCGLETCSEFSTACKSMCLIDFEGKNLSEVPVESVQQNDYFVTAGGMIARGADQLRIALPCILGGMPGGRGHRKQRKKKFTGRKMVGDGNENRPPKQFGTQQIATSLYVKPKLDYRTVKLILSVTSSAGGTSGIEICTNSVAYNASLGTATVLVAPDTTFATQYETYKVKKVQCIWDPIVATSTAVGSFYYCYDPVAPDASFSSASLATIMNYLNSARFDPRLPDKFTFRITPIASSVSYPTVETGGWIQTSQIGNGAAGAYTTPGTIPFQASSMGATQLLGRLEVIYLFALKGRI